MKAQDSVNIWKLISFLRERYFTLRMKEHLAVVNTELIDQSGLQLKQTTVQIVQRIENFSQSQTRYHHDNMQWVKSASEEAYFNFINILCYIAHCDVFLDSFILQLYFVNPVMEEDGIPENMQAPSSSDLEPSDHRHHAWISRSTWEL